MALRLRSGGNQQSHQVPQRKSIWERGSRQADRMGTGANVVESCKGLVGLHSKYATKPKMTATTITGIAETNMRFAGLKAVHGEPQ